VKRWRQKDIKEKNKCAIKNQGSLRTSELRSDVNFNVILTE
jgi:hypothetical protein